MAETVKFEPGKSYPIETLPDDLHDETIRDGDRWAIRDVLLWNDCQGWWLEGAADYLRAIDFSGYGHVARFWQPLPVDPMTRQEILAERGMVVCPKCDWAIKQNEPHECRKAHA